MKIYAPEYYERFHCIADRCRHSCCIGWEIDVDEETAKKYEVLTEGYGGRIANSIEKGEIPHFRLGEGDRCPHLDERGLCRIITELGEEYLCEICREHPRFYHRTDEGMEVGIGMACEEACRLILFSDGYDSFMKVGVLDGEAEPMELNCVDVRQRIYRVLSDRSIPYVERLREIGKQWDIDLSCRSDGEWRDLLASLEYLDETHRVLFQAYSSDLATPKSMEEPLERALAYFVFRHCAEAWNEEELRASLGFCLFLERLLASLAGSEKIADMDGLVLLARTVSEELEYSEDNTEAICLVF